MKIFKFLSLLSVFITISLLAACQAKGSDKGKSSEQTAKAKVPTLILKKVNVSETPFFDLNPDLDSDFKKKADQESQAEELANAV